MPADWLELTFKKPLCKMPVLFSLPGLLHTSCLEMFIIAEPRKADPPSTSLLNGRHPFRLQDPQREVPWRLFHRTIPSKFIYLRDYKGTGYRLGGGAGQLEMNWVGGQWLVFPKVAAISSFHQVSCTRKDSIQLPALQTKQILDAHVSIWTLKCWQQIQNVSNQTQSGAKENSYAGQK